MRELFVLDEHHDICFNDEGPTKMSGRDHDGLASRALTEVVARCAHRTTPDDPLARASESRRPQNLAPREANLLIAEGREIEARVYVATIALDGRSWTLPLVGESRYALRIDPTGAPTPRATTDPREHHHCARRW